MIKSLFLSSLLTLFIVSASFGQHAFLGKLWANGQESECNWFFQDNLACMQLKFTSLDSVDVDTRIILNAATGSIKIITYNNGLRTIFDTHADSLTATVNSESVEFISSGKTETYQELGTCQKLFARSVRSEYMTYLLPVEQLDLSSFAKFFKDDETFLWISQNQPHSFPVKLVKVSVSGELIRSFIVEEVSDQVPASIWK